LNYKANNTDWPTVPSLGITSLTSLKSALSSIKDTASHHEGMQVEWR